MVDRSHVFTRLRQLKLLSAVADVAGTTISNYQLLIHFYQQHICTWPLQLNNSFDWITFTFFNGGPSDIINLLNYYAYGSLSE